MKSKHNKRTVSNEILPILKNETVMMENRNCVTVYGCKRILNYEETEIDLQMGKESLTVLGKQLRCSSFCGDALTVRGQIAGVFYQRVGKEEKT